MQRTGGRRGFSRSRSPFLRLVCGVALALAGLGCSGASESDRLPNILLVTLDTTRPDHLGPYGYARARTPALDALAAESTVYENAYSTSSWTLPSHASLFTGLLPMQHGAQSVPERGDRSLGYGVRPLGDGVPTLAERLRDAGYRTGAVVAGPALRRELGVARGFELYRDELDTPERRRVGKRAEAVTDEAIELLDGFGDESWFLFVNYFDPHSPYRPPPPFDEGLAPGVEAVDLGSLVGRLLEGEAPRAVESLSREEREKLDTVLAGYDAEIHYMDHHLGRLLDAIARLPGGAEALVIVTGDHGESFGEHFYVSHGAHLYEDNVRVPLLVRWPGAAARRVSRPVQNHRVFATALRAAGVERTDGPPPLESAVAAPIVLEVRRSESNVRLFGEFFDRDLGALYTPPWKLIASSRGEVELYDVESDPRELQDRAGEMQERKASLANALEGLRAHLTPRYEDGERAALRPETEAALKALGYLD